MQEQTDNKKSVGGKIPETLFWQFKETYAKRRESATEALENAIRLYIDIDVAEQRGENNG
jgi:hypothetical protein